ncbi:hypothetical protein ACFQX6_51060 [Streptosporangium lutulentum]
MLRALDALGVGFGACHTEYAMTPAGPRIIEVNYRVIGDHCDFLVADLLGVPLFERILGVHLGARANGAGTADTRPGGGHGTVLSLIADCSGTVAKAPGAVVPPPGTGSGCGTGRCAPWATGSIRATLIGITWASSARSDPTGQAWTPPSPLSTPRIHG